MASSNPVLRDDIFDLSAGTADVMTIEGTVNKTAALLLMALATGCGVWMAAAASPNPAALVQPWLMGTSIAGFVVAIATSFKPTWAPITAPMYALLEGAVLGALSVLFEMSYPGIAMQAFLLTTCTLAGMLMAYTTRLIVVTDRMRSVITSAMMGVFLTYLVSFGMQMLFGTTIPLIHESGMVGIGFSLFVVVVAAFNLLVDFDFIERGAQSRAPKHLEWYGAFALMVTLVWLYIEFLRLLSKLRDD